VGHQLSSTTLSSDRREVSPIQPVVNYREPFPTQTPPKGHTEGNEEGIIGFPNGQTKLREKGVILLHLLAAHKSNHTPKVKKPGPERTRLLYNSLKGLFYLKSYKLKVPKA